MFFITSFMLQQILYLSTGFYLYPLFYAGAFVSMYFLVKYGEGDFSKFKPCGSYRVGVRHFKSKEFGNGCSVFYPAQDDGSGSFGTPIA